LQLEQISVPPSNHHQGGLPARVSARFNCSTPLFDLNATIQRNSPGLHNNVVINRFRSGDHSVDLFCRAAERFRKPLVITVKPLVSQGLDDVLGLFLIRSFVVNFLIEHRTDSCPLFYSKSQFALQESLAQVRCHGIKAQDAKKTSQKRGSALRLCAFARE
jgi:hypothetical protein